MMGGSETVSGNKDGVHTTAIHVPIGWHRRVEGGQVIYVRYVGSPKQKSSVDLLLGFLNVFTTQDINKYLCECATCEGNTTCDILH